MRVENVCQVHEADDQSAWRGARWVRCEARVILFIYLLSKNFLGGLLFKEVYCFPSRSCSTCA